MGTAESENRATTGKALGEDHGPWWNWLQPWHGKVLLCGILALGIAARLSLYLHNRALWTDEAALALNIVHKPLSELLGPMDYFQNSPLAFLLTTKLITLIGGTSEYALRFLPLLSGIASLFLMWAAARHVPVARDSERRGPWPTVPLLALAFLAATQYPIAYASELRHYATDIALTCLLLWLAFRESAARTNRAKSIFPAVALVGVGVVAVWFSLASIYVLAAIGTTQFLFGVVRRDWRRAAWAVVGGGLWLTSIAAHAHLHEANVALRDLGPELDRFNTPWSMPFPPMSGADLRWFPMVLARMFHYPASLDSAGLGAFALLLGGVSLWRGRKETLCLLTLPFVYLLIGSTSGRYPVYGRFLLFLLPCLYLLLAEGVGSLLEANGRRARVAGGLLAVMLLAHPLAHAAKAMVHPYDRCESRPLLAHIASNWREGDTIYVVWNMACPFRYYCQEFGVGEDTAIVEPREPSISGTAKSYRNEHIPAVVSRAERTWLVFDNDTERPIVGPPGHVNRLGKQLDVVAAHGATLFLYGPADKGPSPRTWPSDPALPD
jgi:hypothetical protein